MAQQMQAIHLILPNISQRQMNDNVLFTTLLSQLHNMKKNGDSLESVVDTDLLPQSHITFESVVVPEIAFEGSGLSFRTKSRLLSGRDPESRRISFKELVDKLDGKLVELNHWGMNIGPKIMAKDDYIQFRTQIAKHSNLYRYPEGEEWPFIIPATAKEFAIDITDTSRKRNPKFEIVYYEHQQRPLLQFDIETTLTQKEAMELFPNPIGISCPGLEEYFRTVFVSVDWGGWECRIDVSFRSSKELDFGYWMIEEGGRYS